MSLVAYGSSEEESESSDHEDLDNATGLSETLKASAVRNEKNGHQRATKVAQFSNDEIFPVKGKSLVLPSPKNKSIAEFPAARSDQRTNSTLQEKEKDVLSSSSMPESEDEIIDIEEEYVRLSQRPEKSTERQGDIKPKSVGSLFSLLPPPWQSDKTWQKKGKDAQQKMPKQPVKISIPSAPQLDSDEEENSDEPTTKKMRTSKGCSDLKSLLPKPKHSITINADNPNKPAVKLPNRPLIPYTLSRNVKKAEAADIKKPEKVKQSNEAGSDDEDTPVSFFTFDDSRSIPAGNVDQEADSRDSNINKVESRDELLNVASFSSKAMNLSVPAVSHSLTTASTSASHSVDREHGETLSHSSSELAGSEQVNNIGFCEVGESETRTYIYKQGGQIAHEYGGYATNDYASTSVAQPYSNYDWEAYTSTNPTGVAESTQNPAQERNVDLEKLQKLQGRKNRREEINIVDVNADDQIGDSAVLLTKYGTEEIAHRPSRKKSDMPTAQQRRKHQITYLAFQAKERELELRQQWSANRQTRRQTQSKYGF